MLALQRNGDNLSTDLLGRARGGRQGRILQSVKKLTLRDCAGIIAIAIVTRHPHPSSSHHHGRHTTMMTTDDSAYDSALQSGTPLAPAMYPYLLPTAYGTCPTYIISRVGADLAVGRTRA